MTPKFKITAAAIALNLGLLASSPLLAQFDGDYAIPNWTEVGTGQPPAGGGQMDTSGAPASILLMGGDDECGEFGEQPSEGMTRAEWLQGQLPGDDPCQLLFLVDITGTGTLSFQWDYETEDTDGPEYDLFGYVLNGDFFQLSDDNGTDQQTGNESINVTVGDEFGFYIDCTDCAEGPANVEISQFAAPSGTAPPAQPAPLAVAVNNPAALSLLILLLAGLGLTALRFWR